MSTWRVWSQPFGTVVDKPMWLCALWTDGSEELVVDLPSLLVLVLRREVDSRSLRRAWRLVFWSRFVGSSLSWRRKRSLMLSSDLRGSVL